MRKATQEPRQLLMHFGWRTRRPVTPTDFVNVAMQVAVWNCVDPCIRNERQGVSQGLSAREAGQDFADSLGPNRVYCCVLAS